VTGVKVPRSVQALAAVFLLAHLALLPVSLEDIDSVNFALALDDYDVGRHQPHPPGYPVYIALARGVRAPLAFIWPDASPGLVDARALALLGVVLGALASVPLWVFFRHLEDDARRAVFATALTLACPLVWFSAGRPMSDVTGLAFVWSALALMGTAVWRHQYGVPGAGRLLVIAALVAGVAAGVRSQTVVQLAPPLLAAAVYLWRARDWRGWGLAGALGAAGLGVWAVPMLVDATGPAAFLSMLDVQAGEDFAGVRMLALHLSPRALAFGMLETFVLPWASMSLGSVIAGLAALGGGVMLVRSRRALSILAVVAVPYAAFHLALQETLTLRYALPLVAPVAYLAVRGLDTFTARGMPVGVALLVAAALAVTLPVQARYAGQPSPALRAVADVERIARQSDRPPTLGLHYAFARALRERPLPGERLSARPGAEVAVVVDRLRAVPDEPLLFLADPARTDLARIDPQSRRVIARHRWGFDTRTFLGGSRPGEVDIVDIDDPAWMAGPGWALSPELQGQAAAAGLSPLGDPLRAFLRPQPESATLVLGGHLGEGAPRGVEVTVRIGGIELDRWHVPAGPEPFLRSWDVEPDPSNESGWRTLDVSARAAGDARSTVDLIFDQLDFQRAGRPMLGVEQGWYRYEYDPRTGRLWRWMAERAVVKVFNHGRDIRFVFRGEPSSRVDSPPTVHLRAGSETLTQSTATRDVAFDVVIPAAALTTAEGRVTIDTDRVFVPADHGESGDRRRLGLQVTRLAVEATGQGPSRR
jgi:hypothetical protein